MKASRLIGILLEEVLLKGDGDVKYENYYDDHRGIYELEVKEDIDASGKLIKRTFLLKDS
jgi:hypothetical protein